MRPVAPARRGPRGGAGWVVRAAGALLVALCAVLYAAVPAEAVAAQRGQVRAETYTGRLSLLPPSTVTGPDGAHRHGSGGTYQLQVQGVTWTLGGDTAALAGREGSTVTVEGRRGAAAGMLEVTKVVRSEPGAGVATTGTRRILVLKVTLPGHRQLVDRNGVPTSDAELDATMRETVELYKAASANQLVFTYQVLPAVLDITPPGEVCAVSALGNITTSAAAAARARGVDPAGFNHVVHVLPATYAGRCDEDTNGRGNISGPNVWLYLNSTSTLAHELGHNLGSNHTVEARCMQGTTRVAVNDTCTTPDGYGTGDLMGTGVGRYVAVNGYHRSVHGWLTPRTVTTTGAQTLVPLGTATGTDSQVLRVQRSDRSWLYLDVRRGAANPLAAPNAAAYPTATVGSAVTPGGSVSGGSVPGGGAGGAAGGAEVTGLPVRASTTTADPWLLAGETLASGQWRTSSGGAYRLVMQSDGNLVSRRMSDNVAVWSTGTVGNTGARAVMGVDGNLVVYSTADAVLWSTGTAGTGASQVLLTSTGLVTVTLPAQADSVRYVWTSSRGVTGNTLSSLGTDTLLVAGSSMVSANGAYRLSMQSDGNLVTRRVSDNAAVWSTGTAGNPRAYALLQTDGDLRVWSTSGTQPQRVLWTSASAGRGVWRAVLGDDGRVRSVLASWSGSRVVWSTVGGLTGETAARLGSGSRLSSGERIELSGDDTPALTLTMQSDGNLVLRNTVSSALLWASGTAGNPGAYALMQTDGNLVVYRANSTAAWSAGTVGNAGAGATIDVRGRVTVLHPTTGVRWQSLRPNVVDPAVGSQYVTGVSVWLVTDVGLGGSRFVGLVDTTPRSQADQATDYGDATLAVGRELVDSAGGVRIRNDGVNGDGSVRLSVTVPGSYTVQPPVVSGVSLSGNTQTLTLGAMDRTGLASFRVERSLTPEDPASWQTAATAAGSVATISYDNPNAGTWSHRLRSVGSDGRVSTWRGPYKVVVDRTPPGAPGAATVTTEGSGVRLRWGAAVDPNTATTPSRGLWYYAVRRNGVLVANVTASSELTWLDPRAEAGTVYEVVALDNARNTSAATRVVK